MYTATAALYHSKYCSSVCTGFATFCNSLQSKAAACGVHFTLQPRAELMFGSRGARTFDEDGARPDERLPHRLRTTGTVLEQLMQMDTRGITLDVGSAERLVHDSAARLQIIKGNLLDLIDQPPTSEAIILADNMIVTSPVFQELSNNLKDHSLVRFACFHRNHTVPDLISLRSDGARSSQDGFDHMDRLVVHGNTTTGTFSAWAHPD